MKSDDSTYGIGLMSGSSCDGVDAALIEVSGAYPDWKVALLAFESVPYGAAMRRALLRTDRTEQDLSALDMALGELFAESALLVMARAATLEKRLTFIASHGHTVAHVPPGSANGQVGTLQIASAAVIAERCGVAVVSDFRPRDMAVGGQGAPLVPFADWILFRDREATQVCLNIGGIANVSVVTPEFADIVAFDTGPGNMPIDGTVRHVTRGERHYDADGEMAAAGAVIESLYARLMAHPFFDIEPPRSTGREAFDARTYLGEALDAGYRPEDLVATVTAVTADSIVQAIRRFVFSQHRVRSVIVSGGGAHNPTLTKQLDAALGEVRLVRSDQLGFPGDAREAIAFALLGHATLQGIPSNVPRATGARKAVVLGSITPA